MAQFRGTLDGNRGAASRLGTKKSGLTVTANGWEIGASARLIHNETTGQDEICVELTSGSNRRYSSRVLFSGTEDEVRAALLKSMQS